MPLRIIEVPSIRLATPVAVGAPLTPATLMLKDTDCPNELGLRALLKETVGTPLLTVCTRLAEEPPTKLLFPPKTANRECFPGLAKVVVRLPAPEESTGAVPRVLVPSAKMSEPEKVPLPGNLG